MTKSVTILKSHFSKQGGAEKYARLLASAFHQKGCQVTVLTTEPSEGSFPFEVISFTHRSKTSVSKLWDFDFFCQEHLKKHPSDIVFGLDRNRFQTHIRASNGVHKAYLQHRKQFEPKWKSLRHLFNPLHSSLLHIEKTSFEHSGLQMLFTNSHLVKNEILSFYKVDPKKICVVHNGVEWNDWQRPFDASLILPRSGPFSFLFIGSNYERKGLGPLLGALRHLSSDFHLSVVGSDKNQKKFERLAHFFGLEKKVSFHGAQSDILPFLQKADCLVIPSFYDPFANVTIEAIAMGVFVISSSTNGGAEILSKETGIVVNLGDEEEMKQALASALEYPKTKARALAIRNSVKNFDVSTQLSTYLEKCLSPI